MSENEEIFQKVMNQGHTAAWDQSWEEAAKYYRQALNTIPDHPMALISLGLALYELQRYEEALQYYMKASRVAPNDPLPVEKIAHLYMQLGNKERASAAALHAAELYLKNRDVNKAIDNWLYVLDLNPQNLTAHSRLALVYERMGKLEDAVSEYITLAALFQRANDLEKAVRAVNHALEILPGSATAVNALAMLKDFKPLPLPERPHREKGAISHKEPQANQSLILREEKTADAVTEAWNKALSILADILFEVTDETSEETEVRSHLQSFVRGGSSGRLRPVDRTRIILHLGQMIDLQSKGDYSQAIEELDRAINAGLEHAAAYFSLGFLQYQTEQLEGAMRNLQVALQHPEFALGARLLLAQIYQKKGRLPEAAVEYLEALRQADVSLVDEDQADALHQLYEPLIEGLNQDRDSQVQKRICDNVSGLLMRADWREKLQRVRQQLPSQADGGPPIPLAEILAQSRSSRIVDSLATIHYLAKQGYVRSAMEEAFYALDYAPTYLPLHVYMGELLVKQGRFREAVEKLMVAARSYSTRGDARHAIQLYRRMIELSPLELEPRSHLIEILTTMGRSEEALQQYMELADVYYNLADLEKARQTYEKALQMAQQARVDRGWQVRILYRIADIDLQSLDWRQALRVYEQIRALQPEDEKARFNLIELNFRLGQESRGLNELDNYLAYLASKGLRGQGVRFLETLVNEYPNQTGLRRRLAEHYQHMGRKGEAVAQLDAIREILFQAGDVAGAIQVVETILALKPDNADEYQRLLGQLRGQKGKGRA